MTCISALSRSYASGRGSAQFNNNDNNNKLLVTAVAATENHITYTGLCLVATGVPCIALQPKQDKPSTPTEFSQLLIN